jgi:Rod binding domain-containing protein
MAAVFDLKSASSARSAHAAFAVQQDLLRTKAADVTADKARQASEDFEAVYLNAMFGQMFTAIDGDGPFGGGKALGVWRSFLTDEYAKSFAKKGGIGIASDVYRTLMAQQEGRIDARPAAAETAR